MLSGYRQSLKLPFTHWPKALLLLVLLSTVACADSSPVAEQSKARVSSQGVGEINAEPDMAILSGDLQAEAESAEQAITVVRKQLDELIKQVLKAGIENKDLQAAQVMVTPKWHYPNNAPRELTGYQARADFQLRLRDLSQLPSMYALLAGARVSQLNPPEFDFSDREALELKAIESAVENARRKAEAGLKPLGASIGKLTNLNINTRWQSPPVMRATAKMVFSDGAESQPQVNVGERSVTATVQVEFSLK